MDTFVTYRTFEEMKDRQRDVAGFYGHSVGHLNRIAWMLLDIRATLWYLDTPQGIVEAEQDGGVEEKRQELLDHQAELEAETFRPPTPTPLEASMN